MTPQETMYLMASSGFISMSIKSLRGYIKRKPVVGFGVVLLGVGFGVATGLRAQG